MIKIRKYKAKNNQYKIDAKLSAGEILALKHALSYYINASNSSVATDVLSYLQVSINDCKELVKHLS